MQKERKKVHKEIIKHMRSVNKSLAADKYLGLNRFRLDLANESWHKYEDGGGHLRLTFKITDTLTKNKGCFICDNYDYGYKIFTHLNDFLIRCSSGQPGHFPPLSYVAYDVHSVVPYNSTEQEKEIKENNVVCCYNWLNYDILK